MTPSALGRGGQARDPHRPIVVGVSGPDGAGKSSLVAELEQRLRGEGRLVRRTYLYGCIFCRRSRSRAGGLSSPPLAAGRNRRLFLMLHGLTDASELAIRLIAARAMLRAQDRKQRLLRRGRDALATPVLVTDRSPLDGLAKFEPRPGSLVRRFYLSLARRFDVLFELEAPTNVLLARDSEHDAAFLSAEATRHARIAGELPGVIELQTGQRSARDLADVAERHIGAFLAAGDPRIASRAEVV